MRTNFKKASVAERAKMTQLLLNRGIKYFLFTDDEGFDEWDGMYVNSKNKAICFEVKNREVASTTYPTTMIEKSKYDFLMSQSIGEPWLFIFFERDQMLFTHHLTKEKQDEGLYEFDKQVCPITTMGFTETRIKDIVYIPIDKANIIKIN